MGAREVTIRPDLVAMCGEQWQQYPVEVYSYIDDFGYITIGGRCQIDALEHGYEIEAYHRGMSTRRNTLEREAGACMIVLKNLLGSDARDVSLIDDPEDGGRVLKRLNPKNRNSEPA